MVAAQNRHSTAAFTLIEVIFAMLLASILLTGVYSIASGTVQMMGDVSYAQEESTKQQAFIELCRRNFQSLSGDAAFSLAVNETSRYYLTQMSFEKDPMVFGFSSIPPGSEKVILMSEEEPGGTLRIKVKYLNQEENTQWNNGKSDAGLDLILMRNVSVFQWTVYDARTGEWEPIWDNPTRRPQLVALNYAVSGDQPSRFVFWIPPVEPPKLTNQNLQQNLQPPAQPVNGENPEPQAPPQPAPQP